MSSNPFLSVISIVSGDTEGLQRTLHSLDIQTFDDYEIVVVVPHEELHDVMGHLKGTYQTRVVPDQGEGIYPAMNVGWAAAKGSYCLFLNAGDELIEADSLREAMKEVQSSRATWMAFSYELSNQGALCRVALKGNVTLSRAIFGRVRILHQALIMSTEFLHQLGGFDENYVLAGDVDLMLRGIAESPLATSPYFLSRFYLGGRSSLNVPLVYTEMRRSQRQALFHEPHKLWLAEVLGIVWRTRIGIAGLLRRWGWKSQY